MLIRFFIRKARSIEVTRRFSGFYWTKGNLLSSIGSKGTEQPWTIFQGKGAWSFLYWSMIEKLFIILILMTKYQFNLLYSKFWGECIQRPIFFPLSYKLDHLPKVRLSCLLMLREGEIFEVTLLDIYRKRLVWKMSVFMKKRRFVLKKRRLYFLREIVFVWEIWYVCGRFSL